MVARVYRLVVVADDVGIVAQKPCGEVQRAFVLVVAVYIIITAVIAVVQPFHIRMFSVSAAVDDLGIIADGEGERAVFGVSVGHIADALVIFGIGIIRNARVVGVARPAEDGHVVTTVVIRKPRNGIARVIRIIERIVIIEVEGIITHRSAYGNERSSTAFFAVRVHIERRVAMARGGRGRIFLFER